MPANQTPDLAPRDEDDDDLETVQMGGKELEELLSSVRPPKESASDWLEHAGLTRTPSDSLANHRDEAPAPAPPPVAAPPPEQASSVALWPWVLAAVAVLLVIAVSAVAVLM